jgi:hypothetical protein
MEGLMAALWTLRKNKALRDSLQRCGVALVGSIGAWSGGEHGGKMKLEIVE